MKKKKLQNTNGIAICDSIVMSVKRKHVSLRTPISVFIAVLGFTSVILSFLGMFSFNFNAGIIIFASVFLSVFYISLSAAGGRALWIYGLSLIAFIASAYRKAEEIALGFKFVYNVIYSTSFKTEIQYYKVLRPDEETGAVTTLFFFYIWLLAIVLYFFTICRPNPILPLITTFPVIEIGLYNGIEMPVFWGVLTVSYWLALFAMSTIDAGEYSGGQSGFVRKNSLFFPKRQMKLKVTEKCGFFIISSIMLVTVITVSMMKITGYKRSEELNQKRRDITEAINTFTTDDLADSLSNLAAAFGFDLDFKNHKLGNTDHVKYKDTTDLVVTVERKPDNALYIKDDNGSVYHDNEWFDLPSSAYKSSIFTDFESAGIYSQDMPCMFTHMIYPDAVDNTIWIKSNKKKKQVFSPYGTDNFGSLNYDNDETVSPKDGKTKEFTYKFLPPDVDNISQYLGDVTRNVYSVSAITDPEWANTVYNYCLTNDLISYSDYFPIDYELNFEPTYLYENGNIIMAELLENSYKNFVYQNYLQVPETKAMNEVRAEFSDIIELGKTASTPYEKVDVLHQIRERMTSMTEYTLDPGKTPSNRDFVNYFLLESPKGYCIHYATSGVMLARMAGIPTRYATGYIVVGDDFTPDNQNEDGSYTIDVKDNRSHAWAEVYLDGFGWVPFEFTAGFSDQSIDTDPEPDTTEPPQTEPQDTTTTSSEENPATTAASQSATTTVTETSPSGTTEPETSVTTGKGSFGLGKGPGAPMPKALKRAIWCVIIAALIAGTVILRRYIIIKLREKRFTTGRNSARIGHIYNYTEKLLKMLLITNDDSRYKEFAGIVEERLGGEYFERGAFEKLTDIALCSGFGNTEPTDEEIASCRRTAELLAENLYNSRGFLEKIRMKLINVLI